MVLIKDDGVDAVLIASNDASHAEFVLAAIAAGKPVLCEKPLAPDVADCERIIAAEQQFGRRLVTVGFMRRFDPGYQALRAQSVEWRARRAACCCTASIATRPRRQGCPVRP